MTPSSLKPSAEIRGLTLRLELYFLFLLCGISVFVVSYFTSGELSIQSSIVPLTFLVIAAALHRSSRLKTYWETFFAFFIFSLTWFLRHSILDSAYVHPLYSTLNGNLVAQLIDSFVVILLIILLTLVSGRSVSSIFLRKGNLRLGLLVGLPVLAIFYVLSVAVAQAIGGLFGANGINFGYLLTLTPYLLLLALSNGFKEELWFRGLFLKKYESFLGVRLSNLLQAPIFAASVVEAEFAPALIGLVIITFLFGLGSGYLMQKTGSILGSSLCEAGLVLPAFLILISTLK